MCNMLFCKPLHFNMALILQSYQRSPTKPWAFPYKDSKIRINFKFPSSRYNRFNTWWSNSFQKRHKHGFSIEYVVFILFVLKVKVINHLQRKWMLVFRAFSWFYWQIIVKHYVLELLFLWFSWYKCCTARLHTLMFYLKKNTLEVVLLHNFRRMPFTRNAQGDFCHMFFYFPRHKLIPSNSLPAQSHRPQNKVKNNQNTMKTTNELPKRIKLLIYTSP